jgi:hypothetical protein
MTNDTQGTNNQTTTVIIKRDSGNALGIASFVFGSLRKKVKSAKDHFMTDVYIVSYPKCGRTWLRVCIGKALIERYDLPKALLLKTHRLSARAGILHTRMTHDISDYRNATDYRQMHWDARYRGKKIVFLTRNVHDTLVSNYFQATKRKKFFEGSLSDFIRDDRFGAKRILTFLNVWHANRHAVKEFLHITYEDMHADTSQILLKVLRFMGVRDISDQILERAVAFSRFENMRKMEKTESLGESRMSPGNVQDEESYKVRKGTIGGHVDYLSAEDIGYIDAVIDEMGNPFSERHSKIS